MKFLEFVKALGKSNGSCSSIQRGTIDIYMECIYERNKGFFAKNTFKIASLKF